MPINIEAHKLARKPTPTAQQYALDAALDLEALLVTAEGMRGDPVGYDFALSEVSTNIGEMALAELDGADVEAVARDVIARLRAKAAR